MRVEGPIRQAALAVELAVRGAQPALRDRSMWILCALESHLAAIRRENTQNEKDVCISCRGRHKKFRRRRARYLHRLRERTHVKGQTIAHRVVIDTRDILDGLTNKLAIVGVEIEFRPLRTRDRPFGL